MGCSPSKAKEKSKSESDPVGRESDATVESRVQLHHPEAIADQTAPKSDKEKRKSDLSTSSRYSRGSMDMLLKVQDFGKQLDKMEEDLKAIESSIAVISNENKMIESREDLLKIKNKLALFLGEVQTLQDKKIDGIQTVDLESGKEEVKTGRKALNKRADQLIENTDKLYKETVKLIEMEIL